MLAIHRPFSSLLVAASLALGSLAVPASAQESGDNIVLEAAEAAKKLESLTATVTLSGAGGFKDFVPTGAGTIRLARQGEAVAGEAWFTRVDSSYIHKKGAEEQQITAMRTPELFIYVDHEKKAVQERPRTDRRSTFSSVVDLMGLPELTGAEPYSRELREATEWEALGREEVNGVLCDVVQVRYDMSKAEDTRGPASIIRTPASKWYLGVEDRLPRRVERITDEGMISFTIILDITDLETDTGLEPASLAIDTPEGYSRTVASTAAGPATTVIRPGGGATVVPAGEKPAEADPALVNRLPAHGFELVDGDGNAVSLDSLKGNVAVLYFWGTWCVPCKAFSPLVSDLAARFENEPVKVFGLPVRERDEAAVRDAMDGYKHTLLLNPGGRPIGCDETARAYKVRRYPTIYVIGADSEVLAVKWPEADVEPSETVAQVEQVIREYLTSMN
jgi:thiol-disulfide isomerase/thioredoxin